MKTRVLIVDDEQNIRRMLRALLEGEGYDAVDVGIAGEAVSLLETLDPHIVLLDLVMPGALDGLATLERIKALTPDVAVIMMSGKATLSDAVRATQLGAFHFLEKPLTPEGVLAAVRAARDLVRTRVENAALRAALGDAPAIIGSRAAMEAVRTLIDQVAPTPSGVLITGESGTGKELIARAIHNASPRRSRPLISVNCAAIPRDLLESEMFGHERGAFTGAHQRRQGKFELAHEGTLFLDEIGDLGLEAQAKLLRALETGTIERVGGAREMAVDVRVVAATNKELLREERAGRFREDLFYRLNVFPIPVPPLRERTEDIEPLAVHFARRSAVRCGRSPVTFTAAAMNRFRLHDWPGNVRELANVVERLTIVAAGEVGAEQISAMVGGSAIAPAASPDMPPAGTGLKQALDSYERRLILMAIHHAGGNVADAARRLETDRANLYRRMRRLEIDRRDTPVSE
jgi:two-component system nitrogen regulation response regulator NtrX